ncbi:FAD:protein FMN transferase [Pasteurella bettyae]|uniref:FAD:protein FMN transferase n=1 Tax=Pasteurella bettyae CCUG 2042 TaxID=1095749 RepID=I3DJ94_9PAST|nr:FAD:protein FMN transferase [Pasteurella bettyae]EIJ71787.1 ApbE family protein [Pasteurella bettyae CCUG 2042]SUB22383.1 thiamine biosynthesis lipoprotein ApbE [Pasteurella bettyae]
MKLKPIISLLTSVLLTLSLTACKKDPEIITLSGKTMGTTYHIKYIDDGSLTKTAEQAHEGIETILKDVNNKMSTYIETSELSRFNQYREINQPIEISADLAKVIGEAIRLNHVTQGALDITVGPIVNLWGFGPEKRIDKQPTSEQIAERKAYVGIDKLKLLQNADKFFLEKTAPELYVDLSSIAKGFGVDQVANYIDSIGAKNYMTEIGGEIRAKGRNIEGKDWQIAIEKPTFDGSRAVEQVIGLKNLAMATSGDYRNYFEENGVRFSHEIDPKTCYPIQHKLASITVLSPSSMTADGLSTGLFVLGEGKALEVAEKENIAVYLIIKTDNGFEVKMSSAFDKLLNSKN